jgi:LysM repeat protein
VKTAAVATPAKPENAASRLPAPAGASAVIPAQKTPAQSGQTAAAPAGLDAKPAATVAAKAQPLAVQPLKAVAVVPALQTASPATGENAPKTYTVVKGDNPVAIAKRMHVNYEEMLKLNNIEDPKKLQIGQILKMPASKQNN